MEDLKTMFDRGMSIADINKQIDSFVHSIDGYDNRLKKCLVLLHLLVETNNMIRAVDVKDFISDVQERINEIDQQAMKLRTDYNGQYVQNNTIMQLLDDAENNEISELQKQISDLLNKYDDAIKILVENREKLTVEQQISTENKYVANA